MTDFRQIPLTDVTVGQEVTVWKLEDGYPTWGQGGTVSALEPQLVLTAAGTDHRFDRAHFDGDMMVEIEVPTDPSACVEFGPDCSGEVEYFDPAGRRRGVQRCAHHRELRAQRYENSIEQYAHSAAAPDWFDPTYAGESWDGD